MSLSKNIKHCRRVTTISLRQFSGNSNALDSAKMSSKVMQPASYYKVLSVLKDYYNKLSTNNQLQISISKEIAAILQRFQPQVYGNQLVRYFESATVDPMDNVQTKKGTDLKDSKKVDNTNSSTLGNVINGLSMKLKLTKADDSEKKPTDVIVPKWKTEIRKVSRSSIISRTQQILNSISMANSDEYKLRHTKELCSHLQLYPESKIDALRDGVIRLLLHVQGETKNSVLFGVINEVFALLGYCKPLPGYGIRILSIDGGGIRGLMVIEMLKRLEELTGKKVYEMFDYICGVSTGALLATSLGAIRVSCDDLKKHYIEISSEVFKQSTLKGTSNLVWSHGYYNTDLWERKLRDHIGEMTMLESNRIADCPRLSAVSAVVNQQTLSAYIFRNYELPWRVKSQYPGGVQHKLWEAARASAAAPTYFEECKLGNLLHQDGGILVNNPTAIAIHEAKLLWPKSPIQCVVSFGTGRSEPYSGELLIDPSNVSSWKTKFMKIVDSATDTEAVHTILSDLLPGSVYFRFNPYMTEMVNMTDIEPRKLEMMERDTAMYMRRNEDKFQQAAKALLEPRSSWQKLRDYFDLKREFLGLTSKL